MPNLKAARLRAKLTQAQLAEKANVGRATIVKLEAGQTTPQPETERRLAEALKIDPRRLRFESPLKRDGEPTANDYSTGPGSGNFDVNPDGSVVILLDLWMREEVQVALFGGARKHLIEPQGGVWNHLIEQRKVGASWPLRGSLNMVHLRELPAYTLRRLAAAESSPTIVAVTSQGLVLGSEWNDIPDEEGNHPENVFLLHVPWSLVLCIDSMGSWVERATEGDSDDRAQ